jgi:hypothetical protein
MPTEAFQGFAARNQNQGDAAGEFRKKMTGA